MTRTAYADLTFELRNLTFRSVKGLPRLASNAPCYRVVWKRGHHGQGATKWAAPQQVPGGTSFVVSWNHWETLSGLHLPQAGHGNAPKKCLTLRVETMNTRPKPSDPVELGVFEVPLLYEAANDGSPSHIEMTLSNPDAELKGSWTLRRLTVEAEAGARQRRAEKRGAEAEANVDETRSGMSMEHSVLTPTALSPAPVEQPVGRRPELQTEEALRLEIQRTHATIFSQFATLRAKRRDVEYLRDRYAALSFDYDTLRRELDILERTRLERERTLATERNIHTQQAELRAEAADLRKESEEAVRSHLDVPIPEAKQRSRCNCLP
eukprot:Hpha_TRINITY_DN8410_c0_g1::TRINITY_DN8410_c0_g1_i1::g.34787::m.34787